MINNLYNISKKLDIQGVFLNYYGPITQKLIVELGELVKERLFESSFDKLSISKVFSLFIEQAQNIIHYTSSGTCNCKRCGMIYVGVKEKRIFVIGGNVIENQFIDKLKSRLDQVKLMNKEELRGFYKKQRQNNHFENSKGAGIGIIEIARKASQPIEYQFNQIDHETSFFVIKSEV